MNKIAQYTVVEGNDDCDLVKKVQAHLELGWMPQGGVSAALIHVYSAMYYNAVPTIHFYQAMTHHSKDGRHPDGA